MPGTTYEIDFIMSTPQLNRNGYRVLTEGICFADFLKNPIALNAHNNWERSIGKWKNLRIENGNLVGTLVFNPDNPRAMEIYTDAKNGFLNSVSIGFQPLKFSENPNDLLPGQRLATVTECELLECSPVNIPGNAGAVKLYNSPTDTEELNAKDILKLNNNFNKPNKMDKKEFNFQAFSQKFNLKAENQEQLEAEVENLLAAKTKEVKEAQKEKEELKKTLNTAEKQLAKFKEDKFELLVNKHIERGAITESQKEYFLKVAKADLNGTTAYLESLAGKPLFKIDKTNKVKESDLELEKQRILNKLAKK